MIEKSTHVVEWQHAENLGWSCTSYESTRENCSNHGVRDAHAWRGPKSTSNSNDWIFSVLWCHQWFSPSDQLAGEPKDTWYPFEEEHPDHGYTFKKYCEHLLDLVEDPVNRHLDLLTDDKAKKQLNGWSERRHGSSCPDVYRCQTGEEAVICRSQRLSE